MDYKKIKILVEKFYRGETTEEEELVLRDFFRSKDLPKEFETEKLLFESFTLLSEDSHPDYNINENLTNLITNIDAGEKRNTIVRMLRWTSGIAAAFIIAFGLYFYFRPAEIKDTYSDPEQAYKATQEVLLRISKSIHHESSTVAKLSYINKSLSNLNELDKISEPINNLKKENENN